MSTSNFTSRVSGVRRAFVAAAAIPALALGLFLGACAENPADSVEPARVNEATPQMEPAVEIAESTTPVAENVAPPEAVEAVPGAVTYVIDAKNSKIEFVGSKVTRSHDGGFGAFSGFIGIRDGEAEGATLSVTIQTDSIWSDDDRLTAHLKSADFFDVAKFPESTFVLTGVTRTTEGYDLSGDLTLHGVTRNVTFPAAVEIDEDRVRATSEFFIDRYDFGIEYRGMADDLIRREVVIKLDINAERREV